jgi:NADPH:quinone reductase-like Zn-dependent oxidoreductase
MYGTMSPLEGSFSEYIKAPIHQVAKAWISGKKLSMEEIASLPLVRLTAWQALPQHVIAN